MPTDLIVAGQPEPTGGPTDRFFKYGFPSQLNSVDRDRKVNPTKMVQWFLHWERTPQQFKVEYEKLDAESKGIVRELQAVFEAIQERESLLREATEVSNVVGGLQRAFKVMPDFIRMVATKHYHCLFLVGPGGLGKTYTVENTLENLPPELKKEHVRITGYSTPVSLYNLLYKHKDKMVVLDDCDNIFDDKVGLAILKAATDTLPRRVISWNSSGTAHKVDSFEFKGQILFVSNMDPTKKSDRHFQALLTRAMTLVVAGTRTEVLMHILAHLPMVAGGLGFEAREEILIYLHENHQNMRELSLRSLVQLVKLYEYNQSNWKELATALY